MWNDVINFELFKRNFFSTYLTYTLISSIYSYTLFLCEATIWVFEREVRHKQQPFTNEHIMAILDTLTSITRSA